MKLIYEHKRIFGLDVMRAIAIMLVLFGHCAWILPNENPLLLSVMSLAGFLGVEIFFVLSGFLIGKILYQMFTQGGFKWSSVMLFLRRRWFRTLPNYYLILLLNFAIAFYIGYEVDYPWRYFFFLQNFATPMTPFFSESWSLSVEEFAYIFLPTSLLVASSFNFKRRTVVFAAVVILLILVVTSNRYWYHINTSQTNLMHWNVSLKAVVLYRLDSIFIGVLFSILYCKFSRAWNRYQMLAMRIGLLGMMFFSIGIGYFGLFIENHPIFWNVFYLPLTSLAIAMFLPVLSKWKEAPRLISVPVVYISVLSYSMYLLHYGVVLQLMRYHFDVTSASTAALLVFILFYIMLTMLLSYFLYRFFEKPATDLREQSGKANLERFFPYRTASREK